MSDRDRPSDATAVRAAIERLAQLGPDAARSIEDDGADQLVLALAAEHRTDQRRAAEALGALAAASPPLQRALRRALDAADPRLRWGAAFALGRGLAPGPELWPAALETLTLDDGDQRWAAAELACAIARRHPEVHAAIRAELGAASATRRKMCLYCLRDLGDREAPALAATLLADPDAGVRLAALALVARVEPASATAGKLAGAIAALLEGDADPGVRRAAAATLGKLGTPAALVLAALRAAAASADPSLARAARGSLALLGAPA